MANGAGQGRQGKGAAIGAAVAGTVFEYYDFAVYGFLAIYIAKVFFPTGDGLTSLLLTVATFGVGFFMRPVGAIVLGGYADRAGRKAGLTLTISLMALGTGIIALAPSYETIGVAAPLLIVAGRLLQGFSGGGELGSATAFLLEHAGENQRGRIGSLQQVSQAGSLLLGSLVSAAFAAMLTQEQMVAWGWRIPFLIGLLIVPIGLYLRANVKEGETFAKRQNPSRQPIRDAISLHGGKIAAGFGVTIAWTVCTYCLLIYMPTFSVRELGLLPAQSLLANALGLVAVCVFAYLSGSLSDKVGRRLPMILAAAAIAVSAYFAFAYLTVAPSLERLILVQLVMGALVGIYTGPAPSLMGEMFPVEVRSSGFSIAYNFAVTIFGGFAPFISTWLIASTGSKLAPAIYVMVATVISIAALALLRSKPAAAEAAPARA